MHLQVLTTINHCNGSTTCLISPPTVLSNSQNISKPISNLSQNLLVKVMNGNYRKMCKICLKVTIKTPTSALFKLNSVNTTATLAKLKNEHFPDTF